MGKRQTHRVLSTLLALIMALQLSPLALAEGQSVAIVSQAVTPDDASIEVSIGQGITQGILRIFQVDHGAGFTADSSNFFSDGYLAQIFYSQLGTAGVKTAVLEDGRSYELGKDVYAALMDTSSDQQVFYTSGPVTVTEATQVAIVEQSITQLTQTVTVRVSGLPENYILRILELSGNFSASDFISNSENWLCTQFSGAAPLTEGENTVTLTRTPSAGKRLYAVIRDVDTMKDYSSSPVSVSSAVNEILSGCSVTLSIPGADGDGKVKLSDAKSAEASYTLSQYVDGCHLSVVTYPPNSTYDYDAGGMPTNLGGGDVTRGGEAQTYNFNESVELKPGMKIRAFLYINVGGENYKKIPSNEFTVVDENGEGFTPYQYPAVNIVEQEGQLKAGDKKLHLTLTGDGRIFDLAQAGKLSITVSIQQYPADESFDFEGSYMRSLHSPTTVTEPFTNMEFELTEGLTEGYRVRAVVYWSQDIEDWVPKGNDYEYSSADNSVIVAPGDNDKALTVSLSPSSFYVGAANAAVTLGGEIPDNAVVLLYQYPKDEDFVFGVDGNGEFLVSKTDGVTASNSFDISGKTLSADNNIIAVVLVSGSVAAQSAPAPIMASTGAPAISLDTAGVTGGTSSVTVTLSGDVAEGSTIVVKQYPTGSEFDFYNSLFVANKPNASAGSHRIAVSGLTAGSSVIAVLLSGGGVAAVSDPVPVTIKTPAVSITEDKITTGDTQIKALADFEPSYYDSVEYRLYLYTGDVFDEASAKAVAAGNLTSPGSFRFYIGKAGQLTAGSHLIAKLSLTVGDDAEDIFSGVKDVEPAPDWDTPTVSIGLSAARTSDAAIPVTVNYDEGYLTIESGYYCNITLYQFPAGYTDDEFKNNEMHESTVTQVIGTVNAQPGQRFTTVEIPVSRAETLSAGSRLIAKLRLPHPEWEDEEADYFSYSIPVIGDDDEMPEARVLLFNLGSETETGAKMRDILDNMSIEAVTIAQEDINETVGYLAGRAGYESVNQPYTGEDYTSEFLLMSALSETQLDALLAAMGDAGISIDHKAVVTEYNKDWPFIQLIGEIEKEHRIFQAILALDEIIDKAELLDESDYTAEQWAPFAEALAHADAVLRQGDPEPTLEDYQQAAEALKAQYEALTGSAAEPPADDDGGEDDSHSSGGSSSPSRPSINPNPSKPDNTSEPQPDTRPSPVFTDVNDNDWYSSAVSFAAQSGLMTGVGGARFAPDEAVTRGMAVTVLHRLAGQPDADNDIFSDVAEGQFYSDAVAWADANSLVTGYGDGSFGPDDHITREQLAVILYRYAALKGLTTTTSGSVSGFADADMISQYARDAMSWAVSSGLFKGDGSGRLEPNKSATRAEAATVFMRFNKLMSE